MFASLRNIYIYIYIYMIANSLLKILELFNFSNVNYIASVKYMYNNIMKH